MRCSGSTANPGQGAQLDLPLLTKEHEKRPHDARVMFYLAQTLDLIDENEAALAMYQKRIDAGGWQQEVFEAHMRRVRTHSRDDWLKHACILEHMATSSPGELPGLGHFG